MTTMPPVPMEMIIKMFSFVEFLNIRLLQDCGFFCLPSDRREFGERVSGERVSGEREFGEWINNHGVFLSVKVSVLCW